MPLALIMKDIMVSEQVDEEFQHALHALNDAGKMGMNFAVLDAVDGSKIMVNIPNILMLKEMDE